MRILITGGAGFIGKILILKLLSSQKNKVFNIDKLNYASYQKPIEDFCKETKNTSYTFLEVDLANKSKTFEALKVTNPDLIFHLAAESHVDRSIKRPFEFIQTNIIGTYNLLSATLDFYNNLKNEKQKKFRFHHISTDEVFGSLGPKGYFSEDSSYDPRSPYSASKASSDHLVKAWYHTYSLPVIISNCSNNYGPWQYPEKLIPKIIFKAIKGNEIPIYGNGSNIRDWLYVEDHVDALILLSKVGEIGETYCIGGNGEKSNNQVANEICKILDKKFPRNKPHNQLIKYVLDRPGHDQRYSIDFSKIKNTLGWEPKYNFSEGLLKTIDWYLENINWMEYIIKKSDSIN